MLDRIKKLPAKLLEIWKKYTKKQRAIIISTVATVFLTLIMLVILLNRIQYEKLTEFEDTTTAKKAIDILSAEGIEYRLDEDMKTVEVNIKKKQQAVLLLSGNEAMLEDELSLKMLLENDLSTTSSDKLMKAHLYYQGQLRENIKTMEGVEDAEVLYFPTDNKNSILSEAKDLSCSVKLVINDDFDMDSTPRGIATLVAYAIGNSTTDKIKVIDQHGNMLFGGDEKDEKTEMNKTLAYKKLVEKWYNEKLFELAIKNNYSDAEIAASLDVNCDQTSVLYTEYLAGEGLEQGLYDEYTKISSENTGTNGDIPGTDSNNETDYYIQNSGSGNSSYDEERIKYKPSERVTNTLKEWGVINNENSSMGVTLTRVETFTQKDLELLGTLEGTTFEEYVAANSEKRRIEVDEDLYQLFSDASGIPSDRISIMAYVQPNYIATEEEESKLSLILEIALAALIIALLAFVVFRAKNPDVVIETEPELSIERLLATTKENQSLEDIEFGEKSETRKLIEKYVDENASQVAALMRNWLNDDSWD